VRRIDNERRAARGLPTIVPGRWGPGRKSDLRWREIRSFGVEFGGAGGALLLRPSQPSGKFLVSHKCPISELGGPLERNALLILVGERTLKVWISPRRTRRRPPRLAGRSY